MPRQPAIDDGALLDAALRLVDAGGPRAATVRAIGDAAGVPTGSVYHRFRSRDELLARLWLDTVEAHQAGFLAALDGPDPRAAGEAAALHVPRWCRRHPREARLLLLHRREDLLEGGWPHGVAGRARHLNDAVEEALRRYARALLGTAAAPALRRVVFALVDAPVAAVRRHLLAGDPPPPYVDDLVRTTYRAVLEVS